MKIAKLAREALAVQDACNLSGVVLSWARAISALRSLGERDEHPINQLWADKVAHLTGTQTLGHNAVMRAYKRVHELAKEDENEQPQPRA